MSQQKEVLCEIARVISGNDPFRIEGMVHGRISG
jgi:hypothetical protein